MYALLMPFEFTTGSMLKCPSYTPPPKMMSPSFLRDYGDDPAPVLDQRIYNPLCFNQPLTIVASQHSLIQIPS